jgi:arginyl-tRNA synthetase
MNVLHQLQAKLAAALSGLVADSGPYAVMLKPAQDAKFGDYQANCAMSLGKAQDKPPRDVAAQIVEQLDLGDMLEPPEIAGPGFINLRLRKEWLGHRLQAMAKDERLGVDAIASPKTYVIDFSSPNVAKPMHVGHLRSTIIGDALTRMLRFLGHTVITDNHLGDWGLQFGILLNGYKAHLDAAAYQKDPVSELARLYKYVYGQFKKKGDEEEADPDDPIKEACRMETAKLHAGDAENVALWQQFMPHCYEVLNRIYRRLDIQIDHTLGESFYNPMLPGVVADLRAKGIAVESQGAIVVPMGEGEPPAIIQKRDAAFTYTTSDLATIKYRMDTWKPDAILYVVDKRQEFHFKSLFRIARQWGYDKVALEHISFGSVLGADKKPLKAREGEAVYLEDLLDEATARALKVVQENADKEPTAALEETVMGEGGQEKIAQVVGYGAVKYADLCQNRASDYVFSWDKMLTIDGNSATYMQYAYARNRAIFRKGHVDPRSLRQHPPPVILHHAMERALAAQLIRLEEILTAAADDYHPHVIGAFLWDLCKAYSGFNHDCQVLKAETPALRQSRLLLCDLTSRGIQLCLNLLGIRTLERM